MTVIILKYDCYHIFLKDDPSLKKREKYNNFCFDESLVQKTQ